MMRGRLYGGELLGLNMKKICGGWEPRRVPRHCVSDLWVNILRIGDPSFVGGESFGRVVSKWERKVVFVFGLMIEWGWVLCLCTTGVQSKIVMLVMGDLGLGMCPLDGLASVRGVCVWVFEDSAF